VSYKLIGRYVFNWDIGVSGSYKLQSGRNFGRTINAALPVSGSQTVLVESPTAQRARTSASSTSAWTRRSSWAGTVASRGCSTCST